MPVIQGRTREQLRVAIGHNLGAVKLITAAATGTTTTFLTNGLWGGTNDNLGWLQFTGPTNNDGSTARVLSSAVTAGQFTLTMKNILAAALTATAAADTAELWDIKHNPLDIHELINQAIIELTGLAYDPEESLALFADGVTARFSLPTEFAMVNRVDVRTAVSQAKIHTCGTVWDESVDGDVTASQDTEDYKRSSGSLKLVVAATASANDILATDSITSLDLSGYDYVEFWIKSTVAEAAGGLQLLLDNAASCASPQETLNVPALTADTWTYCRVALANPELDTAIISVGLKYVTGIGACTIWLDDIKAVLDASAVWEPLEPRLWRIDQEARTLVLTAGGRSAAGYRLMKLTGGDKPALLTTDAGTCEIDDQFVIARATELALLSAGGGPNTDPDALRSLAAYWRSRADAAKRSLPFLTGVRTVG